MSDPSDFAARKAHAFDLARTAHLPEAEALLHALLGEAPNDLGARLLLGDVLHAALQPDAAKRAYQIALAQAGASDAALTEAHQAGLARALQRLGGGSAPYADMLDRVVPPETRSARFGTSINILLGRAPIYLQQPTRYYFPELPQQPIYPRTDFLWAEALETQTGDIRAELLGVMARDDAFTPYLPASAAKPGAPVHRLVGDPSWSAFYLWKDGARQDANCALCPKTAAAIDAVPLDHLPGQAPSVLFSLLKPGAHIPPHHGLINTRLICHLPLIVPGPAWIRVGNHRHLWKEGKLFVFDDSFEHEAMNAADGTRVVLLFDIWRPELTARERVEVAALIGAITQVSGPQTSR